MGARLDGRATRRLVLIAGASALSLVGCGDGEDGSAGVDAPGSRSDAAASRADDSSRRGAPEFDPDARYNGKTLDEYASGLDDLNASVRERALEDILNFGVNAYPLRQRMQTMASSDTEDELRAGAVAALYVMEDPGADAFVLERLRDSQAFQTDRGWRLLLRIAVEEIEPEQLVEVARDIAEENTAHAERLLGVGGPSVFRESLAMSLMPRDHSDQAVALIFQMLSSMDVTPSEQIAYVEQNHDRLADPNAALSALRAIGTAGAFEAALRILDATEPPLQTRLSFVVTFPGDAVAGSQRLDAIAPTLEGASEPEAQQILGAMEQVAQQAGDDESWASFQRTLTGLAATGDGDPRIRALAMIYLCDGAGGGHMNAQALDPVLAAIESDPEEVILGTALGELQKTMARAPEPLLEPMPARLVTLMYARATDDSWWHAVADGLLKCLSSGASRLDMDAVLSALHAQLDANPGHPVNFVVLQWIIPMGNQLSRAGADMPTAARLAGRLLVDSSIGPAEADWLYTSANLSVFNNTSVADIDTIMAHYEPILMTAQLPEGQYFRQMHETAIGTLYHLKREPDKAQRVLEWAQRMANQAPPTVQVDILWSINTSWYNSTAPAHRSGCAHLDVELAGRPARLKVMSFGSARNRKQALAPGHFVTEESGEVFLMAADTSADPRSLGRLGPIETPMTIAFLDAQGRVIAMGRTDDESLHTGRGRALSLTHPEALHALVYPEGEFELSVGDQTGLNPDLLAAL